MSPGPFPILPGDLPTDGDYPGKCGNYAGFMKGLKGLRRVHEGFEGFKTGLWRGHQISLY